MQLLEQGRGGMGNLVVRLPEMKGVSVFDITEAVSEMVVGDLGAALRVYREDCDRAAKWGTNQANSFKVLVEIIDNDSKAGECPVALLSAISLAVSEGVKHVAGDIKHEVAMRVVREEGTDPFNLAKLSF